MAYRLYQTEGIILATRPRGEASLLVDILMPDLGLVTAIAQGVRKANAKLRGHLGYSSVVRLGLVRGKEYWRLVSAEVMFEVAREELLTKLRAFGRVLSLVQRLVRGEAPLELAYYDLKDGWNLALTAPLSPEELNNYSLLAGARLLATLGYLEFRGSTLKTQNPRLDVGQARSNLIPGVWSREMLTLTSNDRAKLVGDVSAALLASHL